MALAGRSELRACLDLIYLHKRRLHLGALVWAAVGKDPGFTPESLIDWMCRHAVFRADDLLALATTEELDLKRIKKDWLEASEAALDPIRRLPLEEAGCFYIGAAGDPVTPDPESVDFSSLVRHVGSIKGAVPKLIQ